MKAVATKRSRDDRGKVSSHVLPGPHWGSRAALEAMLYADTLGGILVGQKQLGIGLGLNSSHGYLAMSRGYLDRWYGCEEPAALDR